MPKDRSSSLSSSNFCFGPSLSTAAGEPLRILRGEALELGEGCQLAKQSDLRRVPVVSAESEAPRSIMMVKRSCIVAAMGIHLPLLVPCYPSTRSTSSTVIVPSSTFCSASAGSSCPGPAPSRESRRWALRIMRSRSSPG